MQEQKKTVQSEAAKKLPINHTDIHLGQGQSASLSRSRDDDHDLFSTLASKLPNRCREATGWKGCNDSSNSFVGDLRDRVSIGSRYNVKLDRPVRLIAGTFLTRTATALFRS
jgi:hypothetical protein